jgi:hypothetical protein
MPIGNLLVVDPKSTASGRSTSIWAGQGPASVWLFLSCLATAEALRCASRSASVAFSLRRALPDFHSFGDLGGDLGGHGIWGDTIHIFKLLFGKYVSRPPIPPQVSIYF